VEGSQSGIPIRSSRRWLLLAVALLAAFLAVCFLRDVFHNISDDALITYRYARNISEGHGFVYNQGERVLGTTTPFYTVLVALAMEAGIPPWNFSLILDCFLVTGLIALVFYWLGHTRDPVFQWMGTIALFHAPQGLLPLAGMETAVFNLLSYGGIYLAWRGRFGFATAAGLLAVTTRPEGAVALLVILVMASFDFRRRRVRWSSWPYIAAAGLALCIYALALWAYFGSFVPQSVVAKRFQTNLGPWEPFINAFFREQFFGYGLFTLWGAFEWLGVVLILWRLPALRPLVIWMLLYIAFLAAGNAPYYVWYMSPLYPIRTIAMIYGALIAGRGLVWLLRRWAFEMGPRDRRALTIGAALALLILTGGFNSLRISIAIVRWSIQQDFAMLETKSYERAGAYIRYHSGPDDVILTSEIGYVGYFSERPVYDVMGLVTPEAAPLVGNITHWELALKRQPRFVVYSWPVSLMMDPPWPSFPAAYQPIAAFRDEVFHTMVFEYRDTPEGRLATMKTTRAGILPALDAPAYAVEGKEVGNEVQWDFQNVPPLEELAVRVFPDTTPNAEMTIRHEGKTESMEWHHRNAVYTGDGRPGGTTVTLALRPAPPPPVFLVIEKAAFQGEEKAAE